MEEEVLSRNQRCLGKRPVLLRETPRVPGNQTSPPNITELQHQHDDAFKANASSTMRWAAPLKAIEVIGHRLRVDLGLPHLLFEEDSVVDTLAAGENLLATDEDVIRVGEKGVFRIGHGVERTSVGRELIC